MEMKTILRNGTLINEGKKFVADILIANGRIEKIASNIALLEQAEEINAEGLYILPGCIDDQVHFREPGLTHKGNIYSESRAAVAGGITSFMEMPNTVPNALTQELLEDKYQIASQTALANYSFFMGASNDNLEEVLKTDTSKICGVKVFMGSSTGNMLVDKESVLEGLFSRVGALIATHCEDEHTVKSNLALFQAKYEDNIPVSAHPLIRSEEACYLSSSKAAALAKNTRRAYTSYTFPPLKKLNFSTTACLLSKSSLQQKPVYTTYGSVMPIIRTKGISSNGIQR